MIGPPEARHLDTGENHGERQRDDSIDRRVMNNIRFNARRLARQQTVPGMAVEDYEQDLVLDLLHRRKAFDPARASFATFRGSRRRSPRQNVGEPDPSPHEKSRRTGFLNAPAMDENGHARPFSIFCPTSRRRSRNRRRSGSMSAASSRAYRDPFLRAVRMCFQTASRRARGLSASTDRRRMSARRVSASARWITASIYFIHLPDGRVVGPVCGTDGVILSAASTETLGVSIRLEAARVHLLLARSELPDVARHRQCGQVLSTIVERWLRTGRASGAACQTQTVKNSIASPRPHSPPPMQAKPISSSGDTPWRLQLFTDRSDAASAAGGRS